MSETGASEDVGAGTLVGTPASEKHRPPLRRVKILLPVWGYRFVRQFLEFMLPTLLAPGNIPAIAELLPCEFVLLTSTLDVSTIRAHPSWRQLARICNVELQAIDDLITDGNHTATITLAYARVVRETGDAMVDTGFLFLVSDYLIANGSLRSVVERLLAGASGVLAGNFQIIAEEAIPLLRRRVDPSSPYILLRPRELITWSLSHLHPATTANIVNFRLSHNKHTNRLFWRVDENTLIGRFYLMHMIGIRPEVTDFVVGSSCDYSFVPEMCPSGNVVALTDSDDYFVVEMQPRDHEHRNLVWGPLETKDLAASLSEWTTAQHRRNVDWTLVYHAEDVPANIGDFVAEADAYVADVARELEPEPQPHRHHHYWIGSIAAHRSATRRAMSAADWAFILGAPPEQRGGITGILWRLRFALFGRPPDVSQWHPRWPDYRLPQEYLKKLTPPDGRILVVAEEPRTFGYWLSGVGKDVYSLEADRLLGMSRREYMPLVGTFDVCLIFLPETMLRHGHDILERIGPLLRDGGSVMILVTNDRSPEEAPDFGAGFAHQAGRLVNLTTWVAEIHYVRTTRLRDKLQRGFARIGTSSFRDLKRLPFTLSAAATLTALSYISNRSAIRTENVPPADGMCSSIFMIMRSTPGSGRPRLPKFNVERELHMMRSPPKDLPYQRSLELRDESGLELLGLTTNLLWHDDPGRLPTILARYRFVAKLLAERHDVGELGCADAFGTRIVLQDVRKITVYDSNPIFIDDVRRRYSEEWPLDSHVHDIMKGPLPKPHDSIFSLDVIDHISPDDEDTFVRHLRDSLSRDQDILIIGGNGYEEAQGLMLSRTHRVGGPRPANQIDDPDPEGVTPTAMTVTTTPYDASGTGGVIKMPQYLREYVTDSATMNSASKSGLPIFPRTGAGMKALLERYFYAVFMFSMVGEVIHAGLLPVAQYNFALCCGRK